MAEQTFKSPGFFENEIDLSIKGIIDSPILGPKGNKEFLIYGQK